MRLFASCFGMIWLHKDVRDIELRQLVSVAQKDEEGGRVNLYLWSEDLRAESMVGSLTTCPAPW